MNLKFETSSIFKQTDSKTAHNSHESKPIRWPCEAVEVNTDLVDTGLT